jgi:trans-L-3-hydroxyproline dehydratase
MYGCIVTPPVSAGADIGVLFMHNEGYSTMCGHGIIAITKIVLECGLLPMRAPETIIGIDTPAGLVVARAQVVGSQVTSVLFRNVASFVLALDQTVAVEGLGEVGYDLAFGGAFYAYVQAGEMGLTCTPKDYRAIIEKGIAIKRAIVDRRSIPHPFEEDLSFLYGTIFVEPARGTGAHSRNVCVFAEGEVDRCPTGTGVSGRLAIHHARGEIDLGQSMVVESIIGTRFTGRIVETMTFGAYPALIPEIEGSAHITGRHEFLIDPGDPLRDGFILR